MTREEFFELKPGDQVVFTRFSDHDDKDDFGDWAPPIGTVMTRKETWMDSPEDHKVASRAFKYEVNGVADYHFFYPEEIEAV